MTETKNIAFVILGSATGGTLRYLMSLYFISKDLNKFPWATFTVNLIGCFIIGAIYAVHDKTTLGNENIKLLLATGFCGGFTTFSAFAIENLQLIKIGSTTTAITYILLSVTIGILFAFIGYILFK